MPVFFTRRYFKLPKNNEKRKKLIKTKTNLN